jgi:hypothetical protein
LQQETVQLVVAAQSRRKVACKSCTALLDPRRSFVRVSFGVGVVQSESSGLCSPIPPIMDS